MCGVHYEAHHTLIDSRTKNQILYSQILRSQTWLQCKQTVMVVFGLLLAKKKQNKTKITWGAQSIMGDDSTVHIQWAHNTEVNSEARNLFSICGRWGTWNERWPLSSQYNTSMYPGWQPSITRIQHHLSRLILFDFECFINVYHFKKTNLNCMFCF